MPKLTAADWEEIYYALDYKLTSPAVKGSDRESREWRSHLNRILKTIGPDGTNMVAADAQAIKAIAIVEGGIVQEVLCAEPLDAFTWDWDDFRDDPESYMNERFADDHDTLKALFSDEAYADIQSILQEAIDDRQAEETSKKALDPFHDVPEVANGN